MIRLIPRESLKQELCLKSNNDLMEIINLGEGELKMSNLWPNVCVKV